MIYWRPGNVRAWIFIIVVSFFLQRERVAAHFLNAEQQESNNYGNEKNGEGNANSAGKRYRRQEEVNINWNDDNAGYGYYDDAYYDDLSITNGLLRKGSKTKCNRMSYRKKYKSSKCSTETPSIQPTDMPSIHPSNRPSFIPSSHPTRSPSDLPTFYPSVRPTSMPSTQPTASPSLSPSITPSARSSSLPSKSPSDTPTTHPTRSPSSMPSHRPSSKPTNEPSGNPTSAPYVTSSNCCEGKCCREFIPSNSPTVSPSDTPTLMPSFVSDAPTISEPTTNQPSIMPSFNSTPTLNPIRHPSSAPSQPQVALSSSPSDAPSVRSPSIIPSQSVVQSAGPSTVQSSIHSNSPTSLPPIPTSNKFPADTINPSVPPSNYPITIKPTSIPSARPTVRTSNLPSSQPIMAPSIPSAAPSRVLSALPSKISSEPPSFLPSRKFSESPSTIPTVAPTSVTSLTATAIEIQVQSSSNYISDHSIIELVSIADENFEESFTKSLSKAVQAAFSSGILSWTNATIVNHSDPGNRNHVHRDVVLRRLHSSIVYIQLQMDALVVYNPSLMEERSIDDSIILTPSIIDAALQSFYSSPVHMPALVEDINDSLNGELQDVSNVEFSRFLTSEEIGTYPKIQEEPEDKTEMSNNLTQEEFVYVLLCSSLLVAAGAFFFIRKKRNAAEKDFENGQDELILMREAHAPFDFEAAKVVTHQVEKRTRVTRTIGTQTLEESSPKQKPLLPRPRTPLTRTRKVHEAGDSSPPPPQSPGRTGRTSLFFTPRNAWTPPNPTVRKNPGIEVTHSVSFDDAKSVGVRSISCQTPTTPEQELDSIVLACSNSKANVSPTGPMSSSNSISSRFCKPLTSNESIIDHTPKKTNRARTPQEPRTNRSSRKVHDRSQDLESMRRVSYFTENLSRTASSPRINDSGSDEDPLFRFAMRSIRRETAEKNGAKGSQ
eukprot:CAMPEP_0116028196 /NCGR_PEP_ID=MMETSP0321-20121206/15233_1 /TAXON_ID=163516 /ORGANISM="Leptocylindrus danicus var. danicus, Strain B650" /LENGTH=942 /DNA_ID=CAMNT_0003502001 /DNA_START=266 /DNA_END=3096 /DNA_ORIENTATION=-